MPDLDAAFPSSKTMSFDQGRDTLDRVDSIPAPSSASHVDNELPLPPKPEADLPASPLDAEARERLSNVLQSDIGISTLLNRLKQSVSSARVQASTSLPTVLPTNTT